MVIRSGHLEVRIPILLSELRDYFDVVGLPANKAFERLFTYDSCHIKEACSLSLVRFRRARGPYLEVSVPLSLLVAIAATPQASGSILEAARLVRDRFRLFVDTLKAVTPSSLESELELRRWKSW